MQFQKTVFFDQQTLDNLTSELSDIAIAKQFNCVVSTVYLARKEFGIKSFSEKTGKRISRKSGRVLNQGEGEYFDKLKIDRTYFQSIDSEIKAYTLGILSADGFISNTTKGRKLGIELKLPDSIVLYAICKSIAGASECDRHIKQIHREGKNPTEKLEIYSRDLVEQLIALGFGKKAERQCVRGLSPELTRHYLRGVFDGDGHINSQSTRFVLQLGAKDLAYGFAELIESHLSYPSKVKESVKNGKPFYTFGCYGVDKAKPVIEWLYSNCTIAIPRKLNEANIWLSRF